MRARIRLRLAASVLVAAGVSLFASAAHAYDWLQYNFDAAKSGNNTLERTLHRNNVGQLVLKWQVTLPGNPDGSAVLLDNVPIAGGPAPVVFVNTRAGHLLAYDARNGNLVWSRQNGPGSCLVNGSTSRNEPCNMVTTPAIDPNRQYIYTYGLGGFVHKYQVATGTEVTGGGWPQLTTLKGQHEKHGGALAIATVNGTSFLYVVHGGYPGDAGDYQGHLTTINLTSNTQAVFNVACSNQTIHLPLNSPACTRTQNAIWARPGVVFHPALNRVLFATGNGAYTGNVGGFHWSESILALNHDGTGAAGKPIDAYTPTNFQALDNADADLGSTAPVILPYTTGSPVAHLGMQGGKDGKLRLVNLANLSGQNGPGHLGGEIGPLINMPQGGILLQQPAVWVNHANDSVWTFVATNNGAGIAALKVVADAAGNLSLATQWQNTVAAGSPIVANNILYATGGNVRAFDAATGVQLWSTPRAGGAHFHSPIVANGELYVTDSSNRLSAFALAGAGANVDAQSATGTSSNVNSVLEPGETVQVAPSFRNVAGGTIASLTGTATSFTGPAGAAYAVGDSSAGYGTLAPGAAANCFTATGNCYRVSVNNPATRPALNWVATLAETLSTGDTLSWRLHVGTSFADVPTTHILYRFVETLVHNGVTVGFADGTFQPSATATRAATAILVARGAVAPNGDGGMARYGSIPYAPYAGAYSCQTGGVTRFGDIGVGDVGCKQLHYLASLGVNVGFECGVAGNVCPAANTSRASMAVLIAGAMAGGDVNVPLVGTFNDTGSPRSYDCANVPGSSHFTDVAVGAAACRHVNYLWARGVVDGYGDGSFQPAVAVSRSQMAKFVTNGFRLAL